MRHIDKKLATSAVENVALHSRYSFTTLASKINVMSGCGNHAFSFGQVKVLLQSHAILVQQT